jgi:glycine dehydrogenase subunit 2
MRPGDTMRYLGTTAAQRAEMLRTVGAYDHYIPSVWADGVTDPDALRKAVSEKTAAVEVSEFDVVRHYTRLSRMNYGVDTHVYPLGSCTMKYNPKISEDMARLPGFARLHPLTPDEAAQGALQLVAVLGDWTSTQEASRPSHDG